MLLPVLLWTLVLTGSRSGLLSFIVIVLAILYFGQKKGKYTAFLIIIFIPLVMVGISKLTPELRTRYLSMFDSSRPGYDTAVGRFYGMRKNLSTVKDAIIFGHGFSRGQEANANKLGSGKITHNIYIEAWQEVGLIGLAIFISYIVSIFKDLKNAKKLISKLNSQKMWIAQLALAINAWVTMNIVYSFFSYGLRSWEWYFFGGLSAVCLRVSKNFYTIKSKNSKKQISGADSN
jgi:O-antigen ligase